MAKYEKVLSKGHTLVYVEREPDPSKPAAGSSTKAPGSSKVPGQRKPDTGPEYKMKPRTGRKPDGQKRR